MSSQSPRHRNSLPGDLTNVDDYARRLEAIVERQHPAPVPISRIIHRWHLIEDEIWPIVAAAGGVGVNWSRHDTGCRAGQDVPVLVTLEAEQ